jgi:hypothetical protein
MLANTGCEVKILAKSFTNPNLLSWRAKGDQLREYQFSENVHKYPIVFM